jgi:benzoyl-CoA reductase/2-hydroxyglutaryl-CoA dehydratase subunit BcrC/BadD/HgdB
MAVAFQEYAAARRAGADPMAATMLEQLRKGLKEPLSPGVEKVVVGVATAFEKVLDVVDRVRNFVKGNGFQTVDDVFERAYSGRLAKERAFNSALEYIEPDQIKRSKRLDQWARDNEAPLRDIDAEIGKIDEQIRALKTQATTGGC